MFASLFHSVIDVLNGTLQMDLGDAVDADFGMGCVVLIGVKVDDDGSYYCCSYCYYGSAPTPAVVSDVVRPGSFFFAAINHPLVLAFPVSFCDRPCRERGGRRY